MPARLLLPLLLGLTVVAAAVAWGLLGADDPAVSVGDGTLRDAAETNRGPTGPLRREGVAGASPGLEARLVGRPGPSPIEAPDTRDVGAVTITVRDAAGVPLARQWISVFVDDAFHSYAQTGPDGRVTLEGLPRDGSAYAVLGRTMVAPEDAARITGGTVSLRASSVLSLRVEIVDAETGAPLSGPTYAFTAPELGAESGALPAGSESPVRVSPGAVLVRPWTVAPAPAYLDWDPAWIVTVSRYATSLVATHPLRREARIDLKPVDATGASVADAAVSSWWIAGRSVPRAEEGRFLLGAMPLAGVPYYRGEHLMLWMASPDGQRGHADLTLPSDAYERLEIEVVVAPGTRSPPIAESTESAFVDPDEAVPASVLLRPAGEGPAALLGSLDLLVRTADGRPAVGAHVRVPVEGEHRTDGEGRLRVDGVLAGEHVIRLDEPGLVPVARRLTVAPQGVTEDVLQEPDGATLRVTVEAGDGTPLPFARVEIVQPSGTVWVDLDRDGVQRLDPFVDEEGRRTFRRVEPGSVTLMALWGARQAMLRVEAKDRETEEITLRLE